MKTSALGLTCIIALAFAFAPVSRAWADVSTSDKIFARKATWRGMAEIDMGKMAQEKGSSQDVRDFGAMMVKDHTANNDELASLAESKGVKLPRSLDPLNQKIADKLSGLSGAEFDKTYINDMVMGHEKMLALMKLEESSSDPDLKSFATKTSETVQMHLDKAKEIQSKMK